MKSKFISWEEYRETMDPEGKLKFSAESPFPKLITPPTDSKFMAWHGIKVELASGSATQSGTVYALVAYPSEHEPPYKVYIWQFFPQENGLVKIEDNKKVIPYHHTKEIPKFIKEAIVKSGFRIE